MHSVILSGLGDFLRSKRIQFGYTQASLAKLLELDPETIMNIENGRTIPRNKTIDLLADTLNLSDEERQNCHDLASQSRKKSHRQLFNDQYILRSAEKYLNRRLKNTE